MIKKNVIKISNKKGIYRNKNKIIYFRSTLNVNFNVCVCVVIKYSNTKH